MKYAIGFFFGMVLTTLFFSWYMRQTQVQAPVSTETNIANTNETNSVATSSDFDTFYEQFHTDSVFQMNHILFPLEGVAARDSSYVPTGNAFRWQKNDWVLHRKFNDMNGSFIRDFISMGDDLMIENIKHSNGRYGMQRRFSRYEDGWYLIYYAAMNELAVADETTVEEPTE